MVDAYKRFLTNYFNFSGRSTRSDYWYVVLANLLIQIALTIIAGVVEELAILGGIYALATLIPGIALVIRRLHDINKSGWWYFICFVPLVGAIVFIVFLCTASVNENNRFGEIAQ